MNLGFPPSEKENNSSTWSSSSISNSRFLASLDRLLGLSRWCCFPCISLHRILSKPCNLLMIASCSSGAEGHLKGPLLSTDEKRQHGRPSSAVLENLTCFDCFLWWADGGSFLRAISSTNCNTPKWKPVRLLHPHVRSRLGHPSLRSKVTLRVSDHLTIGLISPHTFLAQYQWSRDALD